MIDPLTEDESALDDRVDETLREQRWASFIEAAKARLDCNSLPVVLHDVSVAFCATPGFYRPGYLTPWQQDVIQFAETEGFHGVLSALARAIREHDQDPTVELR